MDIGELSPYIIPYDYAEVEAGMFTKKDGRQGGEIGEASRWEGPAGGIAEEEYPDQPILLRGGFPDMATEGLPGKD